MAELRTTPLTQGSNKELIMSQKFDPDKKEKLSEWCALALFCNQVMLTIGIVWLQLHMASVTRSLPEHGDGVVLLPSTLLFFIVGSTVFLFVFGKEIFKFVAWVHARDQRRALRAQEETLRKKDVEREELFVKRNVEKTMELEQLEERAREAGAEIKKLEQKRRALADLETSLTDQQAALEQLIQKSEAAGQRLRDYGRKLAQAKKEVKPLLGLVGERLIAAVLESPAVAEELPEQLLVVIRQSSNNGDGKAPAQA